MTIARLLLTAAIALAANLPGGAFGHEVRPGYLELRQTGAESWNVLWKVPAQGEMRLSLHPRFPEDCVVASEPVAMHAGGAYIEHTSIACKGGLAGRVIGIDGLEATMTDVLVRSVRADDSVQVARLTPSAPAFVLEAAPGSLQVVRAYTLLGIEHILGGIDHLLFVLGLMLIVRSRWVLVKTITAFTAAHSITLALATLGVVHVPGRPVEAAIALSILLLATEIFRIQRGEASLTARLPWAVAFSFGLLHGFGFANALAETGLPQGDIPLALFTFNVGVELGQLAFIGVVLGALALVKRISLPTLVVRRALPAAAYGIGAISAFWFIDRVAGFWA